MGYGFDKQKGKGYRLDRVPDKLYPWEVEQSLRTGFIGRELVYHDTIDSTNAQAFKLALAGCTEGTAVIAEAQSAGRGRLRRRWHSPHEKNIYLSVVLRPPLHPSQVFPITFISSLAVCDTLEELGLKPALKWPNDVLVNGKKICGTLIELSTEADLIRFVVIGIGLNVNMDKTDMSDDILGTATSLLIEMRNHFARARICGILLNNLEKYYNIVVQEGMQEICKRWEERSQIKGRYMEITQMDTVYRGTAEGIDRDGAILLNDNGRTIRVIAGDVAN
jgi:BirA family transcriptional regulator, biotin operon repressor / biotin---[acetyl-CoA-carboxylase] ligase